MTSRDEVLAAAHRIVERDGWEKLTMRRLAAEIGVGGTTLYRNVKDREDLLILLINDRADKALPAEFPEAPRERMVAAAVAIHGSLATWPWAAEVLTADGFLNRVGPSALRAVEGIVSGALEAGCTEPGAVDVFRSVWYFTVGEILVRANTWKRGVTQEHPEADPRTFLADLDPGTFPALARIGGRWPELASRDVYPEAVAAFIDGLLARMVG